MGDFHTQPDIAPACTFCGTTPNNGDKSCATHAEAIAQTMAHPYGCPWFTKQDRQDWDRRHDPDLPKNQIAALKSRVVELERILREARRFIDPDGDPTALTNRALTLQINRALAPSLEQGNSHD